MTLLKTSFYTGLSVLLKILAVFIQSKVIALYTGPVGLAVIEQFANFIQLTRAFSGSLIQQGVVKYVAEYRDVEAVKTRILSSAFIICVSISLFFSIVIFYFSAEISQFILQSPNYRSVIQAFAGSILLFSLNNFFLALLNGELEIRKYTAINIVNTALVLLLTCYLVPRYGLYGGLITLIFNQSLVLFVTIFFLIRCQWFKWRLFFKGIDADSFQKLMMYVFIMIATVLSIPLSQIILRKYIGYTLSWQDAGYWQGMMKLSNNYAILVDMTLSVYYLPKLAGIKSIVELKNEIIKGYRFIIPLAMLGASCVFIFKKYVVIILYSKEFLPMLYLFKYQLIGDVARIGAWLLSYVMIAKTMVKTLFITEFSFLIYYTSLTLILVHYFGLVGASIGFAVSNILYWLIMLFFINRYTRRHDSAKEIASL